jgi:GNAT superfamily N-acetyltransferase
MSGIAPKPPRAVTPGDLPALNTLFQVYPFKTSQQIVQKLAHERLEAFYAHGLKRAVESGTPHWAVHRDGQPVALGGVYPSGRHSKVYGMQMGRVQPWLNTLEPAAGQALIAHVEREAATLGYEHLSVRVDGADYANLHLFEAAGWRLVDVSLKYSRPMPIGQRAFSTHRIDRPLIVQRVDASDLPWMRQLGATTHAASHFFNDPWLARAATEKLFEEWVEDCVTRLAYHVYSILEPPNAGHGFVIYLRNTAFAAAIGRTPLILDYVVLDPSIRGGGVGPWFIEETLAIESMREVSGDKEAHHDCFDFCELRTSAHNIPAVTSYEKLGFICCGSDFVLSIKL